jgi:phthalate 4,5-cis-dihydrodiol dehydrogenase
VTGNEAPLRLGVAGLGRAFMLMLPTLAHHPRIRLLACADPRPEARTRFVQDFGGRAHEGFDALCEDPDVEAIYLATPHQHHAAQAVRAARAGKHLLVEKPMALTLADCAAMVEAAAKAGTHLMLGHSHGQDGPVRHARRLIAEGRVGAPRLITALACTDFLWRPRRPEELDTALGGGVVFSQAAHQLDIIRVLGGGLLRSLRAQAVPGRGTEGAYAAFLTFADGSAATATYSGFGRYDSDALLGWIGELGTRKAPTTPGAARAKLLGLTPKQEAEGKRARAYGRPGHAPGPPPAAAPEFHNGFGFVLVHCEGADLRLTPEGVEIHDDAGLRLERTKLPALPRAEVLDELCDAVRLGIPPRHDGAWGLATTEACLALLGSARAGAEVTLHHQTRFRN